MYSRALWLAYATALALPAPQAAVPYCLSEESCFPDDATLAAFNRTINGALWPKSRMTMVTDTGVMYTNLEQISEIGCPLPDPTADGIAPAAIESECTLGNMPSYVVYATSTAQIVKAIEFAAEHNLRLRIKNSGHDYTGRSSGVGSLAIWARHLISTDAVSAFIAEGCDNAEGHDVVVAGSGVNVEELYNWGAENGQVTIGGYTTTVSAAGGYILGGGLDILQVETVTADGQVGIANGCQNSDLFWALRGGGGAFGVTTRIWPLSYPALAAVNTVAGQVGCQDYESSPDLSIAWETMRWLCVTKAFMTLINIIPYQSQADVRTANETLEEVQAVFLGSASWNDVYQGVVWPVAQPGSKIGINLHDHSRLVSYDALHDEKRQLIRTQSSRSRPRFCLSGKTTSVQPDGRNAFAFIDVPVFGPWSGTTAEQNATSYYNEQYDSTNWQVDFFGSNYERLLNIKNSIDPNKVFNRPLCVGSEDGH
ncbi:FAD-binding domain-containing protein [Xylaria castorea]|nr:FAD-binding domain-containing protein [Xylaria castorea]